MSLNSTKKLQREKSQIDLIKMSYLQEVGRMNIKEKKLENNS